MTRTIIVDDEARAQRILAGLLKEYCPDIDVIDTAKDVDSAYKLILQHKPDLVFLDIDMPKKSGFKLFELFEEINFLVVFTTAHKEFAIDAIRSSAVDYLLKPIQIGQLVTAVKKCNKILNSTNSPQTTTRSMVDEHVQHKIALPVAEGLLFVDTRDIILLKANGSYTLIKMQEKEDILVSKKLGDLQKLLPTNFFRTHRSFIVNLEFVDQFVRKEGGYLILSNGDHANLSSVNRQEFFSQWQQLQ